MAVTVQQEVAALYSAIFNRAPDQEGLQFWVNAIEGGASLVEAAEGFTLHPVFAETYAGLTNIQFVEQLYINVLGSAGDAAGIEFWVEKLVNGVSQGQVVAEFVQGSLSIDLDALLAAGQLTQAEYDAAVIRQDTLTNKADVGIYFAETFGAASNLDPATDTTTKAGLESDPAYLASQAAIANVTADDASVTAAQGRIDVAVATDDPAGSLIGQNSALTAALVDLQAKQAAVADALEALALNDNANELDAAPVLKDAALDTFVAAYTRVDAFTHKVDAEFAVANAQTALSVANLNLSNARNVDADVNGKLDSDANLAGELTAALAAVNNDADGSATKALYTAVNTAEANLAANVAAKGDSIALLTAVRTAVANLIDAGVAVTSDLDGAAGAGTATFADLLANINAALTADAAAGNTVASDALVVSIAAGAYVDQLNGAAGTATATDAAYNNAIASVEGRVALQTAVTAAEAAFTATAEGAALRAAELAVDNRDALIEAVADAQVDLSDAQSYLVEVNGLFGNLEAAEANLEAAQDAIVAEGYGLNTGIAATAAADLFVADLSNPLSGDYAITNFGAAGDDLLFIGTQFQAGGETSATVTLAQLFAAGSSSALEVFIEQTATDTLVHVESQAFASNGAAPLSDVTTITLTGVTGDVVFENGFISLV